jgi:hypothetical protein
LFARVQRFVCLHVCSGSGDGLAEAQAEIDRLRAEIDRLRTIDRLLAEQQLLQQREQSTPAHEVPSCQLSSALSRFSLLS